MADEPSTGAAIEDFLIEDRTFPPSDAFKKDTLVASPFLYDEADQDYITAGLVQLQTYFKISILLGLAAALVGLTAALGMAARYSAGS